MKMGKAEKQIQSFIDQNKGLGLSLGDIIHPKPFKLLGREVGFLVVMKTAMMIEKSLGIPFSALLAKIGNGVELTIREQALIMGAMVEMYLEDKNGGNAVEGAQARFDAIMSMDIGNRKLVLIAFFHFVYCILKSQELQYPSPLLNGAGNEGGDVEEKKKMQ